MSRYLVQGIVMLSVPLSGWITPVIGTAESSKPLAGVLKEVAAKDEEIGTESDNRRGIAFYSGRTDIIDVHPYNDLVHFVEREQRVWCVIKPKHHRQLVAHRTDLYFQKIAGSGRYVLITNKPYTKR